jgi:hypothetical protein
LKQQIINKNGGCFLRSPFHYLIGLIGQIPYAQYGGQAKHIKWLSIASWSAISGTVSGRAICAENDKEVTAKDDEGRT